MLNSDICALEVCQSSICNLDCVYCYIPKTPFMNKLHTEWLKIQKTSLPINLISNYIPSKNITAYSSWGAEPTLGLKYFKDTFLKILDHYPNLTKYSISTNLSTYKNLIIFLEFVDIYLKSNLRKLDVDIQISLDGPPEINDVNRGEGLTSKIEKNIVLLINSLNNLKNINCNIHTKSTNSIENYYDFVNKPDYLYNYIDYFITFSKNVNLIPHDKNINIFINPIPTLALPGHYTSADGKVYSEFVKKFYSLNFDSKYKDSGIKFEVEYVNRVRNLLSFYKHFMFDTSYSQGLCSAGNSMYGIDFDGTIHGCHQFFWYNYKKYIDELSLESDWQCGDRVLSLQKDTLSEVTPHYTARLGNLHSQKYVQYNLKGYMQNYRLRINSIYSLLLALNKSNQIDPILVKNEDLSTLFCAYISSNGSCWVQNVIATGSLYVPDVSIVRLYGNGAFIEILKQLNY